MNRSKLLLIAVAVAAALGLAVLAIPSAGAHFDRVAMREAKLFCESVVVGDSEATLHAKAGMQSVALAAWPPSAGSVRYQAWFPGFLANASSCEIFATRGVVASRFVEVYKW